MREASAELVATRMPEMDSVPRISVPSADEFATYVRRRRPVIVTGALKDWPASRWSAESLKAAYGEHTIPVAPIIGRNVVYGTGSGVKYDEICLATWLDGILTGSPLPYYAMFNISEVLPALMTDVRVPAFRPVAPWSVTRFWMSPPDTGSPMHQDIPDNLFAQIIGRKRVILVPMADSWRMYREPLTSSVPHCSRVDAEHPDLIRFPRFGRARRFCVELQPGDVLYLPPLWWHQARSLDFSVSINHWWATGWRYAVVRLALAYQRLRQLRW